MREFQIKPKICFGTDALSCLDSVPGRSALLVTDKVMAKLGFADQIRARLESRQIQVRQFDEVPSDPTLTAVVQGMQVMDQTPPDILVALGGGSVIDAAKAVMYALWHSKSEQQRSRPCFIAIPTTSGTGSEVTAFSVVKVRDEKLVLVDDFMLPDIAVLDPTFVQSVPAAITADTGMDVLCHALEAYVSKNANEITDALAEKVVRLVFRHLMDCYRQGNDLQAREKMHVASCLAGMSFTNASLGITHSLAHALGGGFGIPHGRANALMLPHVVAFNADVYGECSNTAAFKYAELAKILDLPCSTVREGVNSLLVAIRVLRDEMNIPATIQQCGVSADDFFRRLDTLVGQALRDNCTPTNPRTATIYDMETLYRQAFAGTAQA